MERKTILITGAGGFIGRRMVTALSHHRVIACDISPPNFLGVNENILWEMADITREEEIQHLCIKYAPDVVVHCAGIAHQKITAISKTTYFSVNSLATETLARKAIQANSQVHFIFLSSISVYGEKHGKRPVNEADVCRPSSDYAESKLEAEKRLLNLCRTGKLKKLDILRLAPVYDRNWTLNIDKRVYAPRKLAFVRFGSGGQKMSLVSRENLVNFIRFRVETVLNGDFCEIFNVCDEVPCSFNQIMDIFRRSPFQPARWCIPMPLILVKGMVKIAGKILKKQSDWIDSCYDKLANDLVFDNRKMLQTGFRPKDSLESIFKSSPRDFKNQ